MKTGEISFIIGKEFKIKIKNSGHNVYQTEWDVKIKSKLKANHETRLVAFVQDNYAMVLKYNDVTVAHGPKSLPK